MLLYADGRIIDAAHCHSPVGGQGLNLGFQDVSVCICTLWLHEEFDY